MWAPHIEFPAPGFGLSQLSLVCEPLGSEPADARSVSHSPRLCAFQIKKKEARIKKYSLAAICKIENNQRLLKGK